MVVKHLSARGEDAAESCGVEGGAVLSILSILFGFYKICQIWTAAQKRIWNCAAAGHLSEAEQQAGDGALLDVQRQQGVGHVDEEHGAPHAGVGRPRVAVQHYQHLATHRSQGARWVMVKLVKLPRYQRRRRVRCRKR